MQTLRQSMSWMHTWDHMQRMKLCDKMPINGVLDRVPHLVWPEEGLAEFLEVMPVPRPVRAELVEVMFGLDPLAQVQTQ